MMICLLFCGGCYSSTKPNSDETSADLSEIPASCQAIQRGWKAPAPGYYLSTTAMRETVQGWQIVKVQAEERAETIEQLERLTADLTAENERTLADLKSEIAAERRSHRKAARSAKRSGIIWGIVIGGAVGAIVAHNN